MTTITLFLCGDVMTGRGIDQILPNPGDTKIFERYVASARDYVTLAERASRPINAPVDFSYIWGDALQELDRRKADVRIVNLETAITDSKTAEPKGINYKMCPANIDVLKAAQIDCCALANNHILDWGQSGLIDTLDALNAAKIKTAGAGPTLEAASMPAIIEIGTDCRICVYGFGARTSGVPSHWAAGEGQPGIRLLPDLSGATAKQIAEDVLSRKRSGDITVISIHWGSNWGYDISGKEKVFAHTLIDLGACDILHGHSSHHARPFEVYKGKLILYGCGDFINDYEGIRGHEEFRSDLSTMYLPRIDAASGTLESLTLVIFQMRRFRLQRAELEDVKWFQSVLSQESRAYGAQLSLGQNGELKAEWDSG